MNIVFRTDASTLIGSGHVMRCLALAQAFYSKGHRVIFVSRNHVGNINNIIQEHGFDLRILLFSSSCDHNNKFVSNDYSHWLGTDQTQDAVDTILAIQSIPVDLLIVDHYALGYVWEKELRFSVKKILVIDDLANRLHDADILLDQNYYPDMHTRYNELVPKSCVKLLGLNYVLLRPLFEHIQKKRYAIKKNRINNIKNMLIYLGAVDINNITLEILKDFPDSKKFHGEIHVIVGDVNPNKISVQEFCLRDKRMFYHCQPSYYDRLLINADWCIGAGGGSTYERIYINLMSTIICVSEHQKRAMEYLSTIMNCELFYANSVAKLRMMLEDIVTDQKDKNTSKQMQFSTMMNSVDKIVNKIIYYL